MNLGIMYKLKHVLFAVVICSTLNGCISIDPRVSYEQTEPNSNGMIRAAFQNTAMYRTQGKLEGEKTISRALEVSANEADTVYIWHVSAELLVIRFIKDGSQIKEKQYKLNQDFRVLENGRLEFISSKHCGSGEAGFGCTWENTYMYETSSKQLAIVKTKGGAGILALVIPIFQTATRLSLFNPITDAVDLTKP